MCGFAGVYEYGTAEGSVSHELIARMRDSLRHRGPDGEGLWISEDARVGLGHRRLAIVDVEGGAQPMVGRQGECLAYNGEIYNYPRLRRELEADAVRFETQCDTEVVLRCYERSGLDCVHALQGMFAFVLWDPLRARMLLARDRLGEKPLYFSDRAGRLVFGSEIKALLEHPAIHPELERASLDAYFTHLVTPPPHTLLRGIFKLAPGEMAICDARGLRVWRYWDPFSPRQWSELSLEDAARRVRALLERSLEERLMSDVPVGVLLSGGIDSTALVALLHERGERLATFSVGFPRHPAFDEREQARRAARHFGTEHHEVSVSDEEAVALLPYLIRHADEPLADPVCVPLRFVSALAATHGVKVLLGGEGSDELFWGYPRYEKIVRWWPLIRLARGAPRALRRAGASGIPQRRYPRLREFAEGVAQERLPPMHMPAGVPRSVRDALLAAPSPGSSWSPSDATEEESLRSAAFDTQEYEFGVRLPERLLMRLDRFSMSSSVEARLPYLAPELVEFAYRLPPSLKIRGRETKVVLRRALGDVIPPWVASRRKQGFDAPVEAWFGPRVRDLLGELADCDGLRSCFQAGALERVLAGRGRAAALWPVLNFALWHRFWIEGRALDDLLALA